MTNINNTKRIVWTLALALPCALVGIGLVGMGLGAAKPNAGGPKIEGTYILEYRTMADGKKITSPAVVGIMTYSDDYRNMNVCWMNDGKPASISLIAKYTLSEKEYTEESMFYAANIDAKGMTYDTTALHGASPVTMKDGGPQFKFPNHGEPSGAFTKDGMIATMPGAFTDHWKKID